MTTVSVRYIVDDVDAAIAFYTRGARLRRRHAPGAVVRDALARRPPPPPQRAGRPGRRRAGCPTDAGRSRAAGTGSSSRSRPRRRGRAPAGAGARFRSDILPAWAATRSSSRTRRQPGRAVPAARLSRLRGQGEGEREEREGERHAQREPARRRAGRVAVELGEGDDRGGSGPSARIQAAPAGASRAAWRRPAATARASRGVRGLGAPAEPPPRPIDSRGHATRAARSRRAPWRCRAR